MLSGKSAKVRISSNYTIESLLAEDGEFYVSASRIATLFKLAKSQAAEEIKTLLGDDFKFTKMRIDTDSKSVDVLTMPQFEQLTVELLARQNLIAYSIAIDCINSRTRQSSCDRAKRRSSASIYFMAVKG